MVGASDPPCDPESGGRSGYPAGAKKASPAAQYIDLAKTPPKLWEPGAGRTSYPVATVAEVPVVTWAWAVYPDETVMAWLLAWPATKPTANSPDWAGVTGPVPAEVPVPAVSEDDGSSGAPAATPENSWTSRATEVLAVETVTLVTGAAPDVYQSSPSELCPDT